MASREQTPCHFTFMPSAKLWAKAMPTRNPVKGPGPIPTAIKSIPTFNFRAFSTNTGSTSPWANGSK